MSKLGYVYIMGNNKPVLYIGVTNDLNRRTQEHRLNLAEGFTKRYNCHKLLYYESFDTIEDAIRREKQLKNWHREWKLNLIRAVNPAFRDLSNDFDRHIELGSVSI